MSIICHLTIPSGQHRPCIGSRCSAWRQEYDDDEHLGWCGPAGPPGVFAIFDSSLEEGDGTDPVPSEPAILDEPAWQALSPLSTRTTKALRDRLPASLWGDDCGEREVTVRELCSCTEAQLLKMRNFARRSLKEVVSALDANGLRLSTFEEWFQMQEKR